MPSRRHAAANAWGAVLRTQARLVPELDRRLRTATGLSLAHYDVLLELSRPEEDRLRMSDLADRVVLSRTRVSRIVDEMVRSGLVRKEANTEDARSSFAALTEAGRKRFTDAAPVYLEAIERTFARGMSTEELRTIATLLERVASGPDAP